MEVSHNDTPRVLIREISGMTSRRDLEKLLNQGFQVPSGSSFFDDFPVWDERRGADALRIGAYISERLVASACARIVHLKTPTGEALKAGVIGCVATHDNWRGEGFATELVTQANAWLAERDVAVTFLWGSEHNLYRRMGFELCGAQVIAPLSECSFQRDEDGESSLGLLQKGWNPAIFEMLRVRPYGFVLEEKDLDWFQGHRNVQWYWLGEGKNPKAYAALGRGIDLQGLIHEWGGEPAALSELFQQLSKKHPEASILGSPFLIERHGITGPFQGVEYLCMAKLLNPGSVLEAFLGSRPYWVSAQGNKWEIGIDGESLPLMSDSELISALFGPERVPYVRTDVLPLPLWIWGLDAS